MTNQFSRTQMILGKEALEKLNNSCVAVFGIGGVGGYCAEALARAGIGKLVIVDSDKISITNINRQIIAVHSSIGRYKTDVMTERLLDINPDIIIEEYKCFFLPETSDSFDFSQYDYAVDAIDTVTGKLEIIMKAQKAGIPVISCMGTGNKIMPSELKIDDIYNTSICPLARVMRRECSHRGIKGFKALYSTEAPLKPYESEEQPSASRRSVPGSVSFVPSCAGLMAAGEVIRYISGI